MYRFRELDISGVGPFGEGNVLHFSDGLTLICGGNGLGKTTIARVLCALPRYQQGITFAGKFRC